MLEVNWSQVHHHWYEGIDRTYNYLFSYADINDIILCSNCAINIDRDIIEIPEHIPESQYEKYAIECLERKHEM